MDNIDKNGPADDDPTAFDPDGYKKFLGVSDEQDLDSWQADGLRERIAKLDRQKPEENYRAEKYAYRAFLLDNGLERIGYERIKEPIPLPIRPGLADLIQQKITWLAMHAIEDGNNSDIRDAIGFCRSLGNPALLLNQLPTAEPGCDTALGLFLTAMEFGTEEQKEHFSREFIKFEKEMHQNIPVAVWFDKNSVVSECTIEKEEEIDNYMKAFGRKHHIDISYLHSLLQINAAEEISKMDYDLVVAVMNAGRPIPALLDAMGQNNVRYLEYRRHWKGKPRWRRIGRNHSPMEKARKILVCEDDIVTGETLKGIISSLQVLEPEQVDICTFLETQPNNHERVKAVLQSLPFYGNHMDLTHGSELIDETNFYVNLKAVLEKLRKRYSQVEETAGL